MTASRRRPDKAEALVGLRPVLGREQWVRPLFSLCPPGAATVRPLASPSLRDDWPSSFARVRCGGPVADAEAGEADAPTGPPRQCISRDHKTWLEQLLPLKIPFLRKLRSARATRPQGLPSRLGSSVAATLHRRAAKPSEKQSGEAGGAMPRRVRFFCKTFARPRQSRQDCSFWPSQTLGRVRGRQAGHVAQLHRQPIFLRKTGDLLGQQSSQSLVRGRRAIGQFLGQRLRRL